MISQFYVLSLRGDNIIFRDCKLAKIYSFFGFLFELCLVFKKCIYCTVDHVDVPKSSAEVFFRNVKFWKGEEGEEAPPIFVSLW